MFRSSAVLTLIALSASVLGFVVQLLLARQYGVSVDVDAYLFALGVPTFIAGLVSAIMSYELVPRLVASEIDQAYQKRYITTFVIGVAGLSLLLGMLGSFFGYIQKEVLPIDSPIRSYKYLTDLIFLGWAISAFQVLQGCLTAILNAHRRYLVAALLALLPYIGMILLLLILGGVAGIRALALGMLTGAIVATLGGVFLIRRHLLPLKFKDLQWRDIRQLAYSSPYTALAMTCFSSYAVVDAYWAPQAGQGTLATLGYAQRIVIALGNLAVAGPSAVVVPRLAHLISNSHFKDFRHFLLRTFVVVGGIAVAVALMLAVFSNQLIQLLFARGAFGQNEVEDVAKTLLFMSPGIVAMLMSVISLRALFCLEGVSKVAAMLGLSWTAGYFLVSSLLHPYGASGLAIGYSLVWILYFVAVSVFIHRKTNI